MEIKYTVQAFKKGKWIDMVETTNPLGAQEQAEHWSSEGLIIRILGASVVIGNGRWIVGGWSVE
jgi:hypothetical protein